MIRVLIVEDVAVVRVQLEYILSADPEIEVIGTAADGEEALAFLRRQRPDVITMDIHMPRMDGLEATRRIMETDPVPIIIVSASRDPSELGSTFSAIEAGATAFVQRPAGVSLAADRTATHDLVRTVKLMSQVKVVRRAADAGGQTRAAPASATAGRLRKPLGEIGIVAIGGSTGAPPVFREIIEGLGKDFPVPVVVVQHMAPGFVDGFAAWLRTSTGVPVHLAAHDAALLPGHVYVAPGGLQTEVRANNRIVVRTGSTEHFQCPAISVLFRSVADAFGPLGAGVILTGMGSDGSKELKLIRDRGGITIAQDETSSVIFGMPGEAVRFGSAAYVLPPSRIAAFLRGFLTNQVGATRPRDDMSSRALDSRPRNSGHGTQAPDNRSAPRTT
jgi:two-component system, chemotaxis family, protein-glutamate methylesterase/glutaminase